MRRDVPKRAAQAYVENLNKSLEKHEEMKVKEEERKGWENGGDGGLGDVVGGLERQEEIERMWRTGTHELERLGEIGNLIGKLERARSAVEVVQRM